jgi:hypothetical protein
MTIRREALQVQLIYENYFTWNFASKRSKISDVAARRRRAVAAATETFPGFIRVR